MGLGKGAEVELGKGKDEEGGLIGGVGWGLG